MRLTQQQADILNSIAADVFGAQASLQLFGSRRDETRRGGDTDLYVKGFNQNLGCQIEFSGQSQTGTWRPAYQFSIRPGRGAGATAHSACCGTDSYSVMNKQEGIEFKFRPALQECWLHQTRFHATWQEAINFTTIEDLAIQTLNDAEVRTLNQSVFRFGKLQDAIGSRFLLAVMRPPEKSQENGSFLYKFKHGRKKAFCSRSGVDCKAVCATKQTPSIKERNI
jgi:hypothetical protein